MFESYKSLARIKLVRGQKFVSVKTFLTLWQQIIHFQLFYRTWPFNRNQWCLLIPSLWLFFFRCFFMYFISFRDLQSEESRPGKHKTCFTRFDQNVLFLQTSTVNPLYANNEMPPETTQISSIKLSRASSCFRLWNGESSFESHLCSRHQ